MKQLNKRQHTSLFYNQTLNRTKQWYNITNDLTRDKILL